MKSLSRKNNTPPTIIDVAEVAGVSMKTVSRVVNNEPTVRSKTRDRVLKAIDRLGYQRNVFARGLRADRSLVLGLLYENPQGDYPADVLHGALARCRESGYHLVVEVLRGTGMRKQTARFLSQTRLDGAIVTPPICDNAGVLRTLKDYEVPAVRISPLKPKRGERFIAIDDYAAAREIVDYLIALGHRRVGFIKGIPGHAATGARLAGYRAALENAGVAFDDALVVEGNFDFDSGVAGAKALLDRRRPPSAIFASNDETAAGVLCFAHAQGLSIPSELSVCGFDGGTISRVVWPNLTTIRQPIRLLGESAVHRLISDGEAEDGASGPVILPHELIVGGSTGPAPGR